MQVSKIEELRVNEIEQVNGGLDGAACAVLTFSGGVMGGTIGAIGGGMFGPAGMAGGGMWGAGFGSSLARSFCS
ncbi:MULTISPECIES: bacteriocin-like peptide [Shewanella]|uniref:bacteriocin-like peptide n=1 Tax=Shewanella TaxID=22 RepID=UPI00217D6A41|nr:MULTISPECIES: bacteriocin-like peptide [Shewanella]MCS6203708.1 bacteriocin-like peptide [Shewanella baltica]MCU8039761.1 bacteriocin-like peptide [Shewanella sp. SM69]